MRSGHFAASSLPWSEIAKLLVWVDVFTDSKMLITLMGSTVFVFSPLCTLVLLSCDLHGIWIFCSKNILSTGRWTLSTGHQKKVFHATPRKISNNKALQKNTVSDRWSDEDHRRPVKPSVWWAKLTKDAGERSFNSSSFQRIRYVCVGWRNEHQDF